MLDASAVVELLFNTPRGRQVAERIGPAAVSLHAPHLLDLEVAQAIRRYVLAGLVSEERARLALEHLAALDVARYGHEPLLPRIWALRDSLSAYDAAYVSLAEALGVPLLTCDRRLSGVPGSVAEVEVLG